MIDKKWGPFFKENPSQGLCQAVLFNGDEAHTLPLLFEKEKIGMIIDRMGKVPFKEEIPFGFYKMVVSGCIRNCMRY
jgi:hypothetical protein